MASTVEDTENDRPARGHDARGGVWINRSAVAMIELPFDHELTPLPDGWRLTATGSGKLTAHLTTGERQAFDVGPGDWLGSAAQELYLAFAPPSSPAS